MNFKKKLLFVLIVVCFLYATYKAEESTSFFGKDNGDVCDGDDCDGDAKTKVDTKHDHEKTESKSNADDSNDSDEINVIITFTNAVGNRHFHDKFRLTVSSLLKHASVPLAIHIIGDPQSQELAEKIIAESTKDMKRRYRVSKNKLSKK